MKTDPSSPMSDVPGLIVVNVRGRPVKATRERRRTPPDEPPPALPYYWIVTVDGERHAGWPSDPGETGASVIAFFQKWIAENLPDKWRRSRF